MSTKLIDEDPVNSSDIEDDDLTVIKGIGPTRQQWLKESVGISTIRDLAALSAEEIESQLKVEGQVASRQEIDSWLAQARKLAATANLSPPDLELAEVAVEEKANFPSEKSEWKPFASFVVEYQAREIEGQAEQQRTTVHYMEEDKTETWPGIERDQLSPWVWDQLSEKLQEEPEEEIPAELVEQPVAVEQPAAALPVAESPVTVAVAQLRAFQPQRTRNPSAIGEADRPFSGFVKGDELFSLEASFELTGPAAAEAAKEPRTHYVQFYAHNLATGATTHLGDTVPNKLVEAKLSYTAVLSEAILPPGKYRLKAVVTVESTPPASGYLEVPLLQVV